MLTTVATWNINSVRLRAPQVARFLERWQPDVLCLQETKCPEGQFPSAAFARLGYRHVAHCAQPGYHGVAIVSRIGFEDSFTRQFCGKTDARHLAVRLAAPTSCGSTASMCRPAETFPIPRSTRSSPTS